MRRGSVVYRRVEAAAASCGRRTNGMFVSRREFIHEMFDAGKAYSSRRARRSNAEEGLSSFEDGSGRRDAADEFTRRGPSSGGLVHEWKSSN